MLRGPPGFVDGPNLYAYCVQNPWTSFDPDGLKTIETYSKRYQEAKASYDKTWSKFEGGKLLSKREWAQLEDDKSTMKWCEEGVNNICKTAQKIKEYADQDVDVMLLDDEDALYKNFNSSVSNVEMNPSKAVGIAAAQGRYGDMVWEGAKEAAVSLAFGKAFQVGGRALGFGANNGGQGLIGMVRAGGAVDDSLGAAYLKIAQSSQFAGSVSRYNRLASWLGQKQIGSVDDVIGALQGNTTFARTGNLRAGLFTSGQHPGSTQFWLQGNPLSAYGARAGRHELLHMGAALRGQGDNFLHEIAVQAASTPENLALMGGILVGAPAATYHFSQ